MNFLEKFRDFVARPTHSRTMGLLIILVLVAVVSLTVIVAQQQQQTKQRAQEIDRAQEINPNEVCSGIEILPTCTPYNPDVSCEEGNKCRNGRIIFECQKQQ